MIMNRDLDDTADEVVVPTNDAKIGCQQAVGVLFVITRPIKWPRAADRWQVIVFFAARSANVGHAGTFRGGWMERNNPIREQVPLIPRNAENPCQILPFAPASDKTRPFRDR